MLASLLLVASAAAQSFEALRISEIMYKPVGTSDFEKASFTRKDFGYIELINTGKDVLELQYLNIKGLDCSFDNSTAYLGPEERGVVVANKNAFAMRYGNLPRVLMEFAGKLSDTGEALELQHHDTVLGVIGYSSAEGWPQEANGDGMSLVAVDLSLPFPKEASEWRASTCLGGSPGQLDGAAGCEVVAAPCTLPLPLVCRNEGMCEYTHDNKNRASKAVCACLRGWKGATCQKKDGAFGSFFQDPLVVFLVVGAIVALLLGFTLCIVLWVRRQAAYRQAINVQGMHNGDLVHSSSVVGNFASAMLNDRLLEEGAVLPVEQEQAQFCTICQVTDHNDSECPF